MFVMPNREIKKVKKYVLSKRRNLFKKNNKVRYNC